MKKAKSNCDVCHGKGYAEVLPDYFAGSGITHIEKCDDCGIFDGDLDAAEQAVKDGVRLVRIASYPRDAILGSEENMARIKKAKYKPKPW